MAKILRKRPSQCSGPEIEKFEKLLTEGDEVRADGLRERIMKAEYLVFVAEDDGTLSAIAALKRPNNSYKRKIFLKARTPENPVDFAFEAGWMFVEDAFRGRKYSRLLLDAVMKLAGDRNVYATTREENERMRRTFDHCEFIQSGSPYPSDEGDYKLVLYTRRSVR